MTQGSVVYGSRSITFGFDLDETGVAVVLKDYEFTREISNPTSQRAGQHGLWLAESFAGGLAAELKFHVICTSEALRNQTINNLVSMFPIRGINPAELATLTFDFADGPKSMVCRRSGSPDIRRIGKISAEVSLAAIAPVPWLLGPAKSGTFVETAASPKLAPPLTPPFTLGANPAGGTVTIVPTGSAPASAVITIYGPRERPGVIDVSSGKSIRCSSLNLGAGDVLEIDLDVRTAKINGNYTPVDITSIWFDIEPYTTAELQLLGASETSAGGQIIWQDAWEY